MKNTKNDMFEFLSKIHSPQAQTLNCTYNARANHHHLHLHLKLKLSLRSSTSTMAMATKRLFFLSPLSFHSHRISSFSSVANLKAKTKKSVKPIQTPPPPPSKIKSKSKSKSKILTLADHLKKRTRSLTQFDPQLYTQFNTTDGDGHVPVMLGEVLEVFRLPTLRSFVDCTLGAAGHSAAIIERHGEMEVYVGMDVDPVAHEKGRSRIEELLKSDEVGRLKAYTHLRNFKYIKSVLGGVDEGLVGRGVDGILMDLGMSSMQVNNAERGFSVLGDGPLDMRMNPQGTLKAEDILNSWPDDEVERILREYGEESNWRLLTKKIVRARANGGLHSTGELVNLIRSTFAGPEGRQGWMKTSTRVFQALRIAVNDELQTLEDSLFACFDCLSSGGRLAVISFHSLEDRRVKQTFLDIIQGEEEEKYENPNLDKKEKDENESGIIDGEIWSKQIVGRHGVILTKRPITPSEEEEKFNHRCRSAKLRVIQKR